MNMPIRPPAAEVALSPLASEILRRRTFAIISHPDAGKTTLTEKLLLFGGAIQLAGQVRAKRDRRSTRSDWMSIERERGISVVTSVMTFEYDGRVFNLLDTPGHEDFSEDTYRTLTAVDSAVMVIDAAKGIEARTRKLFEVCRLRDIPIVTFINKLDRESRDPFELLDEIEKTLALDTAPVTWPIGRGKDFVGTVEIGSGRVRLLDGDAGKAGSARTMEIADVAALNPNLDAGVIADELALVREACKPFDLAAFREGHLSPVFFGSALKNFGVGDLLDALAAFAPPPRAQAADRRTVDAAEDQMTAFVFKIQANMDPNHRDRIAFARLCSGRAHARDEGPPGAHRQDHQPEHAAVLFCPGTRARRAGVRRRCVRHSQSRHAAHRRYADRGGGAQFRRRAELCAGNPAPGSPRRCDESEETAPGAAGTRGGGGRAGVSTARWITGVGRCGWPTAARRAGGSARARVRHRDGV